MFPLLEKNKTISKYLDKQLYLRLGQLHLTKTEYEFKLLSMSANQNS